MEKTSQLDSDQLYQRALKVAPGGVHSPVRSFKGMGRSPVFFEKTEGAYMWDVEGKKYIDYCMSFGPLILGHRDPEVQEEVLKMIHTAWTFGACERYSLELAEWITAEIPWVEKLRFVSSGTEAVMSAIRVARGSTGRTKILKFNGCYHGHLDSLLVEAGSGMAGEASSSSAGVPAEIASTTVVADLDDQKNFDEVFDQHVKNLAAVIIEPIPANYGLLPQREEFLKHIADKCKANKVLLIFDEVISGFRVALGGMGELTKIKPDLVCYGKILGGGFPVGCYGGRKDLMDAVAPLGNVYQAGTLSANPVGMCAGLATLKKMKRLNGWAELKKKSQGLAQKLTPILAEHNLQLVSFESLFWIHEKMAGPLRTNKNILKSQAPTFNKMFLRALDQGLYLAPNAYEVGFLSLAHTDDVINQTVEIIKNSLS